MFQRLAVTGYSRWLRAARQEGNRKPSVSEFWNGPKAQ
jgi:hypothetical protein